MRFLIDAQLPPGLAQFLESRGYEALAARELGLSKASDSTIWAFAISGDWVIVTKDEDFAELSLRAQVRPRILWLRIGNSTNQVLLQWLEPLLPAAVRSLRAGNRLVELRRVR
jgi:predicted nuclease of predicted toxin-antitoxin system